MVLGNEVYSFLDGFFELSLDNDHLGRYLQNCFHYRLGKICLHSHAFWIEKCSTNLPASNEYGILKIPQGVHEIVFG